MGDSISIKNEFFCFHKKAFILTLIVNILIIISMFILAIIAFGVKYGSGSFIERMILTISSFILKLIAPFFSTMIRYFSLNLISLMSFFIQLLITYYFFVSIGILYKNIKSKSFNLNVVISVIIICLFFAIPFILNFLFFTTPGCMAIEKFNGDSFFCMQKIAWEHKDPSYCMYIKPNGNRESCISAIAKSTKNITLCNQLYLIKDSCIKNISSS